MGRGNPASSPNYDVTNWGFPDQTKTIDVPPTHVKMDWRGGQAFCCLDAKQHFEGETDKKSGASHCDMPVRPLSIVFTPPYQLILQEFGAVGKDSNVNNISSSSSSTPPISSVKSLQQWCRRRILASLTMRRIDKIQELPLPPAVRSFLSTFKVPDDFDTDGYHMNYNFQFPNHPHHRTHRVHPAVSKFDNTRVLIKVQNMNSNDCSICAVLGEPLIFEQETDKWATVNHPNLQRCFMKMVDQEQNISCYVLEFPVISLKEVAFQLSLSKVYVPEYLLWDTIYKLASALAYLQVQCLFSELMEPQHFVLDKYGEVKVENLLLYLPSQGNIRYRTNISAQYSAAYVAPELRVGGQKNLPSLTWALGCVFYELAALIPAYVSESMHMGHRKVDSPPYVHRRLPDHYSGGLESVILQCLSEDPEQRPTFKHLMKVSEHWLKFMQPFYRGPVSLLQLLPDLQIDD